MTKIVLTIAASDPSGGAGIEADLKVFAALKVFGMSAITGITVQGPQGVERIVPTPGMELSRILEIMDSDVVLDAVKVGALVSKENLQIARIFLAHTRLPAVLDPLLNSSSGYPLLHKAAWQDLSLLFPLVALVTPNLFEAETLSGVKISGVAEMEKAAKILMDKGAPAVLLKGGHLAEAPQDLLFAGGKVRTFSRTRLPGKFHGLGCALSSAIAANLALGSGLEQAVEKAEIYIEQALGSAIEIGGLKYLSHLGSE